ncbi:MAG: helix-turn-helix domain-containing protein [Treponema sp.]|jgi:excisionase family DNA binding protein|nr:helix-turn-helix domain-containing protein [Treponema sp.]
MEPYLTIKECAEVLRLSEQTIQRYVLKKDIPFLKIKKVIRFRPADIDQWAQNGGILRAAKEERNLEGDLFADVKAEQTGTDREPGEPEGAGEEQA